MAKAVSDLPQQFFPVPPCSPPLPLSVQRDDTDFHVFDLETFYGELDKCPGLLLKCQLVFQRKAHAVYPQTFQSLASVL